MNPTSTFGQAWNDQVRDLTRKPGGLLNIENTEWARRFDEKKGKFAPQKGEFMDLAAQFVECLLNENVPAAVARDILGTLRQLITEPGKQYSSFPTQINNCLLEYINAKLLWQSQIVWPLPGPGIDGAGKQPDYTVDGYAIDAACGDHVRAQSPKDVTEMIAAIADALNDKLKTYKQPQVRVVIDVSDSRGVAEIGTRPQDRPAWAGLVTEVIGRVRDLARLYEIDIVVAPTVVFQFRSDTRYT